MRVQIGVGVNENLNKNFKIYDFIRWSFFAFSCSILFITISFVIIIVCGFNWGLDFTGGRIIELTFEQDTDLTKIRQALNNIDELKDYLVQSLGTKRDVLIRTSIISNDIEFSNKILKTIHNITGNNPTIKKIDSVGPSVGIDLIKSSFMALLLALFFIFIYVSFRFEWRLATGAVLALVHDVVIILGVLSLFYIEIDLTIFASLMSVIGYSLNDSIVIFDRIRENVIKMKDDLIYDIFNISLTQILNRTLITSITTLVVVMILLIFGGSMLYGFSITLLIGIIIGTISSIYVASLLALKLGINQENLLRKDVESE